ncbi:M23 family metallopeptidase [Salinibacterium sp. ZJ450]|uniref:M23 family metallopeptidase n=1 Tax=Salinibacterium sp. ZJ450 TaxID=2708338 RepID=UPI001421B679|nr:M23 family metallopeptidase [Salinibacterium sp. ZJ450]
MEKIAEPGKSSPTQRPNGLFTQGFEQAATPAATAQPLTRRELRERERAAAARKPSDSIAPTEMLPAVVEVGAVSPVIDETVEPFVPQLFQPTMAVTPPAARPAADSAAEAKVAAATEPLFGFLADAVMQVAEPAVTTTTVDLVTPAALPTATASIPVPEQTAPSEPAVSPRRAARLAAPARSGRKRQVAARPATVRAKPGFANGVARKVLSGAAFLFAGTLMVGMTVPANAFRIETYQELGTDADQKIVGQSLDLAGASADAQATTRDAFTVTDFAQVQRLKYGTGNRDLSYTTSGTGPVRWPFPVAVPLSSGYGDRVAPCRGCSSQHEGVDFVPGAGTPIFAIADGVVKSHTQGGAYGNHVVLEHVINGKKVTSLYAHMQWGSSPLSEGDMIPVGEFIGLVGNTGASTGPHLHFEIHLDGVPVNPFTWLKANAF